MAAEPKAPPPSPSAGGDSKAPPASPSPAPVPFAPGPPGALPGTPGSHPPGTPGGHNGTRRGPSGQEQMTQALLQLQEGEFNKKKRQCQWHQNNVACLEQKFAEDSQEHAACSLELAALNDAVDQKRAVVVAAKKKAERTEGQMNGAKRRQQEALAELRQINRRRYEHQ